MNKNTILNKLFPFTLGSTIIDPELLNKITNEISPETLLEWYHLTQYYLKSMQNKLENYSDSAWRQINQMPLSNDFIQSFKKKLDWKWISAHQPLNEILLMSFRPL